ncbi:hypothetical protein F2P81_025171 [Scophthalmus maximus]|uniref:PH domain-containing protein n=1 Tax=Scophthalmus maximus TaxID=52904 RepID=A0A6A4RQY0_SCOMX|nr:hypothetical protein F2P81_025171 [Scophthalmus maximus]
MFLSNTPTSTDRTSCFHALQGVSTLTDGVSVLVRSLNASRRGVGALLYIWTHVTSSSDFVRLHLLHVHEVILYIFSSELESVKNVGDSEHARVDDGVIGYKDLAALPRDKAILDIERPDLMIYSYSPLENLWLENRSPRSSSPGSTVQTSRTDSAHTPHTPHTPHTHSSVAKSSMPHFHRPEKECRRQEQRDDEEEEDEVWSLRVLQKQELNKIQSNLGKIILKEELEKCSAPLRRKTRSLPDRSQNTGPDASRSVYFPASSKSGLSRVSTAEHRRPIRAESRDDGDDHVPVPVCFQLQSTEFSSSHKTPAETSLSGGVPQRFPDDHRGVRPTLSLEEERHEEEVTFLLILLLECMLNVTSEASRSTRRLAVPVSVEAERTEWFVVVVVDVVEDLVVVAAVGAVVEDVVVEDVVVEDVVVEDVVVEDVGVEDVVVEDVVVEDVVVEDVVVEDVVVEDVVVEDVVVEDVVVEDVVVEDVVVEDVVVEDVVVEDVVVEDVVVEDVVVEDVVVEDVVVEDVVVEDVVVEDVVVEDVVVEDVVVEDVVVEDVVVEDVVVEDVVVEDVVVEDVVVEDVVVEDVVVEDVVVEDVVVEDVVVEDVVVEDVVVEDVVVEDVVVEDVVVEDVVVEDVVVEDVVVEDVVVEDVVVEDVVVEDVVVEDVVVEDVVVEDVVVEDVVVGVTNEQRNCHRLCKSLLLILIIEALQINVVFQFFYTIMLFNVCNIVLVSLCSAGVEDAEYMIMSCSSSSPSNELTDPPGTEAAGSSEPDSSVWLRNAVQGPAVPPLPPGLGERAESDSSHYESYGDDDEDEEGEGPVKDRAHYIQWSASQPCLRPAPESRLCGYLWRRKWLGQWTKQLFIVRNHVLLCYKCARDLLPHLELNLLGCQLVYKSKSNRKIQHQLKLLLPGSETLVLGYGSFQQADEWRRSSTVQTEEEENPSSVFSLHKHKGFLNVLMNCQWQSLLCRVEAGLLNMLGEEEEEEEEEEEGTRERAPQYTVQLRGCEVRAGPDTDRSHRITLSMLGDQVAVLEVSGPEERERWLKLLQDAAVDHGHRDDRTQEGTGGAPSGLQTGRFPTSDAYMDDPFHLSAEGRDPPIYSNTSILQHILHSSQDSVGCSSVSSRDSATYSNAVLSSHSESQFHLNPQTSVQSCSFQFRFISKI